MASSGGRAALVDRAFSGTVDRPAAPRLDPPVPCVHVGVVGPEGPIQAALEQTLHVGPQSFLVVLEPEHIDRRPRRIASPTYGCLGSLGEGSLTKSDRSD